MAKKIKFTGDFNDGFTIPTRKIVGEDKPEVTAAPSPSIDSKTKPEPVKRAPKKKSEEIKAVQVYIPASLYKKLIKKAADKSVKANGYCSMSALIKEYIEKGLSQ